MSYHHNAGHNNNIRIANKTVKNVAELKYFRTTNSSISKLH
jgi:hypothetical protein